MKAMEEAKEYLKKAVQAESTASTVAGSSIISYVKVSLQQYKKAIKMQPKW